MVDKVINGSLNVTGNIYKNGVLDIPCEEITYSALKAKRDAGELIPGKWYRITDYQCTTTTQNTSSAGHQFDIIVVADSASVLNENARAALHAGDTYFVNNKLEAWQLKYCLDNNTSRFDWADATNGKGIIYRMIDEFNNDVPYDFKNILFTKSDAYTNAYTFSYTENGEIKDASLLVNNNCHSNVMKEYALYNSNKQRLNFNVFYSPENNMPPDYYNNTFGRNCLNNTFGRLCGNIVFGNDCEYNTFNKDCSYIVFGNGCSRNIFGATCGLITFNFACSNNILGNYCYSLIFGRRCGSNTFGDNCSHLTVADSFSDNTFGDNCSYNTFGHSCISNAFNANCCSNTFGDSCSENSFGSDCSYNLFKSNCSSNTFATGCQNNTFGQNCSYITFGDSSSTIDYCQNIILDNQCKYLYINSSDTSAAPSNQLQNVHIHLGISGSSSSNRLTITVPDRALAYETEFAKNGSTKIVVE